MFNPYDSDENPRAHRDYAEGRRDGVIDRTGGNRAKGSRKWSQAYRYGYSDGYGEGQEKA